MDLSLHMTASTFRPFSRVSIAGLYNADAEFVEFGRARLALSLDITADCWRLTGNPEVILKSD
jgi:hypothetical protein